MSVVVFWYSTMGEIGPAVAVRVRHRSLLLCDVAIVCVLYLKGHRNAMGIG